MDQAQINSIRQEKQAKFDKNKLFLRGYLTGEKMYTALRAYNLGAEWHQDYRKDGLTPEYSHQTEQIMMARTIAGIRDLESVIVIIALHDLPEDKPYPIDTVKNEFGEVIGRGVERMSKFFFETESDQSFERYFYDIARDPNASICKGIDGWHNQSTMVNVFSLEKMNRFFEKTEQYLLPALHTARKLFPYQEPAYSNIRTHLKGQIAMARDAMIFADRLRDGTAT